MIFLIIFSDSEFDFTIVSFLVVELVIVRYTIVELPIHTMLKHTCGRCITDLWLYTTIQYLIVGGGGVPVELILKMESSEEHQSKVEIYVLLF